MYSHFFLMVWMSYLSANCTKRCQDQNPKVTYAKDIIDVFAVNPDIVGVDVLQQVYKLGVGQTTVVEVHHLLLGFLEVVREQSFKEG